MSSYCQSFRSKVVGFILSVHDQLEKISRNSVFLAISIFDVFLFKSVDTFQAEPLNQKIYAIVCLLISWKYQGDAHPQIKCLQKHLNISIECSAFIRQVVQLQQKILNKIDFEIPTTTAYQSLDEVIDPTELNFQQSRRIVAKSIKIILTAVRISSQLSFDPSLGAKIHQITKKAGFVDSKARNIYRKCLKYIQNQQNNEKTIDKIVH